MKKLGWLLMKSLLAAGLACPLVPAQNRIVKAGRGEDDKPLLKRRD